MSPARRLLCGSVGTGLVVAIGMAGACHCGSDSGAVANGIDAGAPETSLADVAATDREASADRDVSDAAEAAGDTGPTTWWDDPDIWSPVPNGERCNLYQADPAKANVPPRVWTSCGPGCLEAPANLDIPIQNGVNRPASSGSSVGDEMYFRLTGGWQEKQFTHVARISDGATLAFVAYRNSPPACGTLALYSQNAALFIPAFRSPSDALGAWIDPATEPGPTWAATWMTVPSLPTACFAWNRGWGFAGSDGTLRIVESPDATAASVAALSDVPIYSGVGRENLAVWPMFDSALGHETLWGLDPTAGARQLVAQAAKVLRAAMSDDKVVWIGVHGPLAGQGTYTAAEIYRSPRTVDPATLDLHVGPSLPATCGLLTLATGGDYAVTRGCSGAACATCKVFVAHLSTGQLWQIPMRPGRSFIDALAATPNEVLLGEFDDPGQAGEGGTYRRLVRLEFAHLDELEHAW